MFSTKLAFTYFFRSFKSGSVCQHSSMNECTVGRLLDSGTCKIRRNEAQQEFVHYLKVWPGGIEKGLVLVTARESADFGRSEHG